MKTLPLQKNKTVLKTATKIKITVKTCKEIKSNTEKWSCYSEFPFKQSKWNSQWITK